jgi:hypothetical protein
MNLVIENQKKHAVKGVTPHRQADLRLPSSRDRRSEIADWYNTSLLKTTRPFPLGRVDQRKPVGDSFRSSATDTVGR